MKTSKSFIPYQGLSLSEEEIKIQSQAYRSFMDKRRTIRSFSDKPVDRNVIENIIMTASSAPSGAHKQPWTFCAVSDPALKQVIRKAAEKEEYINYHGRMSEEWVKDLEPFDTDWNKDFITKAPWVIVIFKKSYDVIGDKKLKNYYVNESIGIASGFLISAIHHAGLVTLTHTPSPMNFLKKILNRPANEKAFLLLPVGHPSEDCMVPALDRKTSEEVIKWHG